MLSSILADAVLALHLGFVVFAVAGGVLVLHRRAWAWVHVPAACWAAVVELTDGVCPLTPLENWLRARAGLRGYGTGFLEHYLIGLIYPSGLTRELQIVLGALVLAINVAVYAWALSRRRGADGGRRR